MLGMSENSKRLHGAGTVQILEQEIENIKPFIIALQQEKWAVDVDYYVDKVSAHEVYRPWQYMIKCSQSDGRRIALHIFKRPHSKGWFKGKFIYSVEVADGSDGGCEIFGYVADTNHMEALRNGLRVYLKQLVGEDDELTALLKTKPDENFLMGR